MKSHLLLATAMFAASVATPIESLAQERPLQTMTMQAHPLPIEGTLPSLAGATTWLNSQPLMPEALRGKVVVVDFWTYACINWQRTEPHVRAWDEEVQGSGARSDRRAHARVRVREERPSATTGRTHDSWFVGSLK
jgi:hypothetical protein